MYPKKVKLFVPWAKAMVAGATVDKPTYSKSRKSHRRKRKARVTRRRRSRAKKES